MRDHEPIVLATANPHKVAELRAIFTQEGVATIALSDLGRAVDEPDEPGRTFDENAAIKALAYARALDMLCLADDSGLEVDALDGAPGVDSAHFAQDDAGGLSAFAALSRSERDALNNAKLLRSLENTPDDRRDARYVCVMTLACPDAGVVCSTRGTFEGRIGRPPRVPSGRHGFGYDPFVLVAPRFESTAAELDPQDKNARSHRGLAARLMALQLKSRGFARQAR